MALTDEQRRDLFKATNTAEPRADGYPGFDKLLAERDARIAELERQLAEARKDAERYRWLRDWPEWEPFDSSWLIRENIYGCPALEMDAAIDNAMQKG